MPAPSSRQRPGVDIVIPFYRNAHLVAAVCESLGAMSDELAALSCSIIAVNDSPGDDAVRVALAEARTRVGQSVVLEVVENAANLGFVRSANAAMRLAAERERDVLLLNSDTVVFPGAVRELAAVAYSDPMIGFVSPRSNNATICSLPQHPDFRSLEPLEAYRVFQELSARLPRYHFAPTAVGFCLFIKYRVLNEVGLFDEVYSPGYNEENDLIMRANRCGYRAAIANHAFVYHYGESSFAGSGAPKAAHEAKNATVLNTRYPEYEAALKQYTSSPDYQVEELLTGLVRNRSGSLDVVFDFSSVGTYHNGTFEVAKEILRRAASQWEGFNVFVLAGEGAIRFHRLDAIPGVVPVAPSTVRKFAAAFRIAQPFSHEQVRRMCMLAPVNVYCMHDPIAYDCLYLNTQAEDLQNLWEHVFAHADGVVYVSDFARDLFHARFSRRAGLLEVVASNSLDFSEYRRDHPAAPPTQGYALVVGNLFHHKRMPETLDLLCRSFPTEKFVALGAKSMAHQNLTCYESGGLNDTFVDGLIDGARVVIFPSVYEGFGIPIVRSLARGRPVLARETEVAAKIRHETGEAENLILYADPTDLVRRLARRFPTWHGDDFEHHGNPEKSWAHATGRIGSLLCQAVQAVNFETVRARLGNLRLSSSDTATLRELTKQVQALQNSWSWRLTAPLRTLAKPLVRKRH